MYQGTLLQRVFLLPEDLRLLRNCHLLRVNPDLGKQKLREEKRCDDQWNHAADGRRLASDNDDYR